MEKLLALVQPEVPIPAAQLQDAVEASANLAVINIGPMVLPNTAKLFSVTVVEIEASGATKLIVDPNPGVTANPASSITADASLLPDLKSILFFKVSSNDTRTLFPTKGTRAKVYNSPKISSSTKLRWVTDCHLRLAQAQAGGLAGKL
jgi:hypothetical protein